MSVTDQSKILRADGYYWPARETREYKTEASHFRDVSRQTLLGEAPDEQALNFITRYFEVQPGGYTSLEHHQHPHAVVVLRGHGEVVLADRVEAIAPRDTVYIAPGAYHQFHTRGDEPLGFLCIVDRERDRPNLPDEAELQGLKGEPEVARRIRT